METTTARKRTVTGVFGSGDIERAVARITETPHTPVSMPRQRKVSEVREYAATPPAAPETFDVRVARAMRLELAAVIERLDIIERRMANSDSLSKVMTAEFISLRNGTLKAASIHAQQVTDMGVKVHEATAANNSIAASLKPLARRIEEQRVDRALAQAKWDAWMDAVRTVWQWRAFVLLFGAAIFTWRAVTFYLDHYPH